MKKLDEKTKNMILFEVIVMIFIAILYIIVKTEIIKLVPRCYILEKTGILCPSCGGTRCIKALLSFNISEAFKMNAFYTITIIYLFNSVRNQYRLKVIPVTQAVANTRRDSEHVFQHGTVFRPVNIIRNSRFHVKTLE